MLSDDDVLDNDFVSTSLEVLKDSRETSQEVFQLGWPKEDREVFVGDWEVEECLQEGYTELLYLCVGKVVEV